VALPLKKNSNQPIFNFLWLTNPYSHSKNSLTLVLFIALFIPAIAYSQESKVHEKVLDNGLKILVKEDHRSPVAVSQVWYKVGSSYEYGGITGISHMLEHMMFKGTEEYPAGEFSRIIAENGGNENAFTSHDYTAYFQTMDKSRLEVSFRLEADRMRNLKILKPELDKELQVVREERRMRTDDKPRSKTREYLMAMAFTNSPYQFPVIGWPADIESYTVQDLQQWYQQWYAPNNAILVVIGDVEPEQVFTLAEQYFGPLQPETIIPPKAQTEMPQAGVRRTVVKLPAKLPYLLMAYKVPALNTVEHEWEAYALEVLAGILDGGNSARLQSRLVRGNQIAVSASAGYSLFSRLPELFTLSATPTEGVSAMALEYALKDQIQQLQNKLVKPEELERIKAQVLAQAIYERDSMFYQGMILGILETVGVGWQKADQYVENINAITAEQIREVARKYLIEDQLNIATLEPQAIKTNHPTNTAAGANHAR
jgi:zinc protease